MNEEQERILNTLLNLIIPPSQDGKMPSAADVGFLVYVHNENLVSWIKEGLQSIGEESHHKYGREFLVLSDFEQAELIESLRRQLFQYFSRLTTVVINCYYQHDHVLEALGLEARPPFPQGYNLGEWDITLLEPVFERGKIYRD